MNIARGELITTRQQFDAEHVARTRAEAEWHGAQAQYDQLSMERESELQRQQADLEARRRECEALSQHLESARAESEALTAVLQTVRTTIQQAIVTTDLPASAIQGHWATGDRRPDVAPHTPGVAAERTSVSAGPLPAPLAGPATPPPSQSHRTRRSKWQNQTQPSPRMSRNCWRRPNGSTMTISNPVCDLSRRPTG